MRLSPKGLPTDAPCGGGQETLPNRDRKEAMDTTEWSPLRQTLHARRDAMADVWYTAIAQTSFVPFSAADVRRHLVQLADQVIELLLAEPFERCRARAIGIALARLHYLQPEALGRTQEVLGRQIVEGLPANQIAALHPRLAALLGELAAGFFSQARDTILDEQEQVREALLTERRRAATELATARRRLAVSRDAERIRLAQELHDGPVQDLSGVGFQLEALSRALPDSPGRTYLATAQTTLQQVIRELRSICRELRPPAPCGLESAIRSHARRFQAAHPELRVQLDLTSDGPALPERVRLALFRIYQQTLNNVVQHAAARRVLIRFALDAEQAILEVQDDGCGFVVPDRWIELARRDHLGLLGAAERAEAIGGRLEVTSVPGEGTRVKVSLPVDGEQ